MNTTNRRFRGARLVCLVAAVSLSTTLVSCNSSGGGGSNSGEDEDVVLRIAWSGSDDRNVRTQDALDLYMEQNPNVDIEVEYTTATNFWDRLTTQVAGGNAPDIIQMSGQLLARYATSDVLVDFSEFMPEPVSADGWEQATLEAQTVDGTLYGIPPGVDGHAVLYDASKLEELGIAPPDTEWTWDDYSALAQEISDAGGEGYYGSEDGGPQYEALQTFMNQRGKTLFDGDELGFDEDDLTDFWQMWTDLRKAGATVPAELQTAQGANPENSGVVQGYAALDFTTSSQYTNFVGLSSREVGMTTYPFGNDGEPGQVWRAGLAWSVTANSEFPDQAADLIDFLVNDSEAGAILQTTRGVPASPTIREEVRGQVDETEVASFEYLDLILSYDAEITPVLPVGFGDFNELFQRLYYEVAFDRMSVDDAVAQFFTEAPGLL